MEDSPWRISRAPARMLRVRAPATGSRKEKNPPNASRTPSAVNQPQPRTPRRRKSKELTNLETPENSSHMPKMKGSDRAVKAWSNRTNRDRSTVRMPSTRNQTGAHHPVPPPGEDDDVHDAGEQHRQTQKAKRWRRGPPRAGRDTECHIG